MLARALTLALGIVVAFSVPARAQHDEEAHGLYSAGRAAFQEGRYDEALDYFQRAYDLSHRSELLYNVGQAADRARHDDAALTAFRGYLDANPDVPNRAEIEGRIHVLERAVASHTTAAPPPTDVAPPPEPEQPPVSVAPQVAPEPSARQPAPEPAASVADDSLDVPGLALTVSGGVVAIAGAIMLGVGVPGLGPVRAGETFAQTNDRQQTASALTGVGATALGLGIIGAVIGAVMLATHAGTPSRSAAVRFTLDGLAVSF